MCKIIDFKGRKTKIDEQIDEMQKAVIREVESAIKTILENERLFRKTRFRDEDVATMCNNERLAIFKLKNLVSDLKGDTRL